MNLVSILQVLLLSLPCLSSVNAQFPASPEGVTVLKSRFHDNVTISYKEVGNLACIDQDSAYHHSLEFARPRKV